MPGKFHIAKSPVNLSHNVFGARKVSVCFLKATHLMAL